MWAGDEHDDEDEEDEFAPPYSAHPSRWTHPSQFTIPSPLSFRLMKVSDLRGIVQYVPRFREKVFVIAVDGEIVASPNFSNILLDIAVLRSLSIKVIIVHGASAQVQGLAGERHLAITNADGTGITDEATLKIAIEAATCVMHE